MTSFASKRRIWQLLFCCVVTTACSAPDTSAHEQFTVKSPVSTRSLPGGRRTRTALYETKQHTETTTVVRTALAWDSLWQRVGPAPRPTIDFDREMLVVSGLALGGWDREVSIRIDGSRTDSLVAVVHIRDGIPSLCIQDGLRAPMAIVRVARDPRPVAFRRELEHLNCGR
jgi:hypothetical protein